MHDSVCFLSPPGFFRVRRSGLYNRNLDLSIALNCMPSEHWANTSQPQLGNWYRVIVPSACLSGQGLVVVRLADPRRLSHSHVSALLKKVTDKTQRKRSPVVFLVREVCHWRRGGSLLRVLEIELNTSPPKSGTKAQMFPDLLPRSPEISWVLEFSNFSNFLNPLRYLDSVWIIWRYLIFNWLYDYWSNCVYPSGIEE